MVRRRTVLGAALGMLSALAGCTDERNAPQATSTDGPGARGVPTGTVPPAEDSSVGYTYGRPSGNRLLGGSGSIPETEPAVYEPDGRVSWLVGVPTEDGSDWLLASDDGRLDRLSVADGTVVDSRSVGFLPAGAPPVGRLVDEQVRALERPATVSGLSHPVVVGGDCRLFATGDGALRLVEGPAAGADGTGPPKLSADVDALPDTRIIRVGAERYALLAGRTGRYAHGALGDAMEAQRVILADVSDGLAVETLFDPDAVIEGTAALAADLTGDGTREVVVTVSDEEAGARLTAVDLAGERLATGPAFPTGNRWRHQLCVAPFGPSGEVELVAVETPHIGGTARFHRPTGSELSVVAAQDGVSSHALGSRNLDGAIAGDFDGDGAVELLVPTNARDELLALRRTEAGVAVAWRLDVGGELASNIAGVPGQDGSLAVAAAGSDGTVRIWAS